MKLAPVVGNRSLVLGDPGVQCCSFATHSLFLLSQTCSIAILPFALTSFLSEMKMGGSDRAPPSLVVEIEIRQDDTFDTKIFNRDFLHQNDLHRHEN
jgi:hypothetical protein